MADPLPPGPAFVPHNSKNPLYWHCRKHKDGSVIPGSARYLPYPPGYIWRPATEGTMGGWVRPSSGERGDG